MVYNEMLADVYAYCEREEELYHERKTSVGLDGPMVWYHCPGWLAEKGAGAAETRLKLII